jgi:hypothetical protein
MRDILNKLELLLVEATLTPAQISKYPERFEAFIAHIQDGRTFYTAAGDEVVLVKSEANRFLQLKADDQFSGNLKGMDVNGVEWPLSKFLKTAEFGGASAAPGDEQSASGHKEGVLVKPTQIGITDHDIPANKLMGEINTNSVLRSTEYGKVVINLARAIASGEPAIVPKEYLKQESIKKAIVDYAGEYLGVLAIVHGQTKFSKRDEFISWLGGDIGSLVLNFPSKSNNSIADSFASIKDPTSERQLNISSKGTGGGAAPSVSELSIPDSLRKKKTYKTALDFIDLTQNKSLPTPRSISMVYQAMNLLNERLPEVIPKEFKEFLPWPLSIVDEVKNSLKRGDKLPQYNKLIADTASKGNDGGKLTYVTKTAVLNIINGGSMPEFQSVILEILDYNFIQQYTTINNKTGELSFETQWPAKLDGKVTLETKSGGTDPTKGGFSFKLKPKGSTSNGVDEPAPVSNAIDQKIDKIASGTNRLDIRPKTAQTTKVDTKKGYTREKR